MKSGRGQDTARFNWKAPLHVVVLALLGLRALLGPALVLLVRSGRSGWPAITFLVVAMLTDIFDGVFARRAGIANKQIRCADSYIDAGFFVCVGLSAWIVASDVVRQFWLPIALEAILQGLSYGYDLIRYRRISSLHAYSAKIWGFSLYISATALIVFRYGPTLWLSLCFGILSFVDASAIKLTLPGWNHDVLSYFHAKRLVRTQT